MGKKSAGSLVVVPCDPIGVYERAGYDWLERYFNPTGMFREVYVLSPLEEGERKAHGMTIVGVPEEKFTQKLKEIRPDVVRAYGGYWPSDLVCRNRIKGIPVIVSIHDVRPELLHESVRYMDLVLCLTDEIENQVLKAGVTKSRIRRLPNRVDRSVFYPVQDAGALQSIAAKFPVGRHILHIGRRTREKNQDTIIRALALLPEEYSCVFIGSGDRGPFVAIAEELGVNDRCFWFDSVKNSELPTWYSWCDCFCFPSRFPSEGFPLVSLEAAACATPMVASDAPPMNEYLIHNQSACLVKEYENPSALANAIRRVCEDGEYRTIIKNGILKVAERFDLSVVDNIEADIYREAMNLAPLTLSRNFEIGAWRLRSAIGWRINALRSGQA
jgi:glycosyltransferase involved in cell wall biosynthesis